MMRILITTQVEENYGAHDWNGEGHCPQYWKCKGGNEYTIPVTVEQAAQLGAEGLALLVDAAYKSQVRRSDDYYREYMIDWSLLGNGDRTPDEAMQEEDMNDPYAPCLGYCYTPTILPLSVVA